MSNIEICGCITVIKKNKEKGGIFPIHSNIIFGKNLECDIRIVNNLVSDKEIRLEPHNGHVFYYLNN